MYKCINKFFIRTIVITNFIFFIFILSNIIYQSVLAQKSDLSLSVRIDVNPISVGETQTLQFNVIDPNSNLPIDGVKIGGMSDEGSPHKVKFVVYTDENGKAFYSWKIPDSLVPGTFDMIILAEKSGYNSILNIQSFELK